MIVLDRLQDTGYGGTLMGLLGAALHAAVHDAFFWLFLVLVAANVADWFAGRFHARNNVPSTFSRKRSRQGIYEKGIALVVVLLIRSLEAVMPLIVGSSTHGVIASAVTAALIYEDIESLDRHRMGLGRAPIPLLSTTLSRLRVLTGGDRRRKPRNPDETS